VLDLANRPREAEASYRRALHLAPAVAQIQLNFGAFLFKHKHFEEAETAYKKVLELEPSHASAWSNLGALYASLHRYADAEHCHRTALDLAPEHSKARFNLAYLLLRLGRFEEGWKCLEARDWHAPLAIHLDRQHARWRGEPLTDKKLLVCYEGGHGDMIQFCRYIPMLKALGPSHITLLCHPTLKHLLTRLEGVDETIGYDELLPSIAWDFWVPILSLPGLMGTRLDTIPDRLPYLHAAPILIEQWASRLPREGLRVGLVWKGNPAHENDSERSLPSLEVLAPLKNILGIQFISLQKGNGEDDFHHGSSGLSLWVPIHIRDFADTAAIVSQLDLVITVDTAVAHLAGALGKPCWVMLPAYQPDWRWLDERSDSPWYPGVMRLFRQSRMGDWASVVADIHTALARCAIAEPL